jgi:hypothetical protein
MVGFAGVGFSAAPGEVIDLPEAVAADAIKAGHAVAEESKTTETAKKAQRAKK